MDAPSGTILRFGVFELDTTTVELRRSGARVRLQEQPARVLLHLLQHRGEIVTREELRRALWPEDTFVDFDHGLNTTINKIRDALGDSATAARFIETVPKKGYRFVAPVEEVLPTPLASVQTALPRGSRQWLWVTAGLVLSLTAGVAFLMPRRNANLPEPVVTPLTTLPGSEWLSSLSPDGERAAFTWGGPSDANVDIYVKQIGSEHMLRLTTDPALDSNPAWSPDGRWIAFSRRHQGKPSELFMMPAMGGAEARLSGFFAGSDHSWGRGISWGPTGKWMIVVDRADPGKDLSALYYLSLDSHQKRRLTLPPDDSQGDADPAVSPDGKSVAFIRRYTGQVNEMYLLRLTDGAASAGPPVRLLPRLHNDRSPAWTADGKELVFQSGWFHLPFLSRLRLGEDTPVRMTSAGEFAAFPSISLRGNRITFRRGASDINIRTVTLGGAGGPRIETWGGSSTYLDHIPRFSPDARQVSFVSNRDGNQALWISDADGSRARRLTNFVDAELTNARWTTDGSAFTTAVLTTTGPKTYLVDLGGGSPKELKFAGHTSNGCTLSRDGKTWFFSSKTTGESQIWKIPVGGGVSVQLTKNGGEYAEESLDGKYLYYTNRQPGSALWRVPTGGGSEKMVLESIATPMSLQVTDEGIYYIPGADSNGRSSIRLHRFATGKSELLVQLDKQVMWGLSVSPDRRTILFVDIGHSTYDQMLMDNFR